MKVKKLLKRLENFLDAGKRKRRAHADSMRTVLATLRKKERSIKARLAEERDTGERKRLERKLSVVHAQRKKGLKALRDLGSGN